MNGHVITCPGCRARYRTSAKSIGETGRTVRCAKCGSTWFVPAPDVIDQWVADPDELALADNMSASPKPSAAAMFDENGAMDREKAASLSASDPSILDDKADAAKPSEMAYEARPAAVGADVIMRNHSDYQKLMRRRRTIRFIWAASLILILIAATLAYIYRQTIVDRSPQMASVYQLIGIKVRQGGLEIDPPEVRTSLVDGASVMRIESVVRNLTPTAKTVPQIELTLHDIDGQALMQWYVDPSPNRIEGHGRLIFTSEITDPPADMVGLRYKFADDLDIEALSNP